MRRLVCDVCETEHEWADADQFFLLEVPAQELDAGADGSYSLDICSPSCLLVAARALNGQQPEEEKPEVSPEKERKIPKLAPIDVPAGPHYDGGVQVR